MLAGQGTICSHFWVSWNNSGCHCSCRSYNCRPYDYISLEISSQNCPFFADFSSPPLPDNVFEGDIDLTDEQRMNIDIYGDIRGNASRAAGSDNRLRWPNGIIPYEIDCSLSK